MTVTPVNNTTVAPRGAISYYVSLNATTDLGDNQTEILSIREDTKQPGWGYDFDPQNLILRNAGDLKTSILTITVPINATEGNYYQAVVADGYQYFNDDNVTIEIQVEHAESGINYDVNSIP